MSDEKATPGIAKLDEYELKIANRVYERVTTAQQSLAETKEAGVVEEANASAMTVLQVFAEKYGLEGDFRFNPIKGTLELSNKVVDLDKKREEATVPPPETSGEENLPPVVEGGEVDKDGT